MLQEGVGNELTARYFGLHAHHRGLQNGNGASKSDGKETVTG